MPQQVTVQHADSGDTAHGTESDLRDKLSTGRPTRLRTAILFCVLAGLLGLMAGFTTNFIPSNSMEPTLNPGDHILTMRRWLAFPFGAEPRQGDIIVFRLQASRVSNADMALGLDGAKSKPESSSLILIKRVIAVGGDRIKVSGNKVFVNGAELHESYGLTPVKDTEDAQYVYADGEDYRVPRGQLFVLGDNRDTSEDSRFWGPLEEKDVLGRFVRILYNEGKNGPNDHRDPRK